LIEETQIPTGLGAPSRARAWIARATEDVALSAAQREVVALLVSELVTNAVVHAGTPSTVSALADAGQLVICVQDGDDRLPTVSDAPGDREGGWGLRLVDQAADAWGAERCDGGKVVWFALAIGA